MSDESNTFEGGDGAVMVDFTNVEEASFEVLPRGTYDVTIESCEYKLSNSSGQPMWALRYVVTDGEYAGRKLFDNMSFSEKALPITKKSLSQLKPTLLEAPFDPVEEAAGMVGIQLRAEVIIQPYNGNDQNRVKNVTRAGASDDFLED